VRNVKLAAAVEHFSIFGEFCLTGAKISGSQHGLPHNKRNGPGVLRAARDANGNVEHKIISGGGLRGGQPQAGGI
jgi:hypothetical protein